MATDQEARQRMAEGLLARMERDSDWRRSFIQALAAAFYDIAHVDCPADCICVTNHLQSYDIRGKQLPHPGGAAPEGACANVG